MGKVRDIFDSIYAAAFLSYTTALKTAIVNCMDRN